MEFQCSTFMQALNLLTHADSSTDIYTFFIEEEKITCHASPQLSPQATENGTGGSEQNIFDKIKDKIMFFFKHWFIFCLISKGFQIQIEQIVQQVG